MSLEALTKRILAFRDARDWKQFHTPKDMLLALGIEVSELQEHFLWKAESELDSYLTEHREEVADELADTLYWVLLLAHDLGVDLNSAFEQKMRKNESKYPIETSRGSNAKYRKV